MRFKFFILALFYLSQQLYGQVKIESITLGSNFTYGIRGINYVTKAIGLGFWGNLKFGVAGSNWKIKFISGYEDMKLEPSDSMTIERWNWDYWRIWYRNHIRTLMADSNYAVKLNPEQRLYVLPVKVQIGRELQLGGFKIFAGLGAGVLFYERAFWLNETWWKKFPNVPEGETYVFQYSFKNNAPSKKGTILNFGVKIDGSYKLTKIASLVFGFEFEHYPSVNKIEKIEFGKITLGDVGESYKNFVLRDVFRFSLGFSFSY
ncbi:hypothetical protein JGI7_00904 [Candidatus Kryptonium thompsonii]|uniref:Outer membrane protein beta-barrel domain-containing protein n=2 Tax=Candidatus Kryptonium thompsonii TaxID=1633631 RepID=A0A0P1LUS6_9BACT|nr:hypothetical protein [Candidatus Kryptonium thompsoni]CUS78854.1 hypothetical protein JGI6_00569 [Candidatus Kryptonium thompsoni]CUS85498.1 hypothetical protein JGI7_00904 [Candidatus Kryptonium thompsoni]CUS85566.1 hypothetical protein JGI13_01205 [Candidatus Kryptonium thompsoni]CUS93830.1 hypothetical protein JGI8_01881 [Candidatus Kryptonium thompsoni]CUT06477.1 hypothetical protein JGI11_01816 [Candidatus Kryptonium thompsoni]